MTTETGSQPTTYTPYQQALINQLLKEAGPGTTHRLVAPVGAGKSFGVAGGVAALLKAGRASRVLVLVPAMLKAQWTELLERFGAEAILLDARSIRVMRNEFAHGLTWPKGVFTMSIDLAKRDDVRAWVSVLPWDFVVIDEAHVLTGQRRQLVRALLGTSSPPGLLLATAFADVDADPLAEEVIDVDWRQAVEDFREERGLGSGNEESLETRRYRRTPDEVALAEEVVATARQFGPLKGMILLRQAASSVLSLEESLNRRVGAGEPDSQQLQVLEPLLDSVEGLQADSKLDCLKALVSELSQSGTRHTVLFCDYMATLNYLCSAVQDLELPVFSLHGGMTAEACKSAFSRFREEGGFLVATAASQFLSMSFVEAVIHYDLPLSQRAFAERVGRYRRYGRSVPCTAYCLEDETGSLLIEAIQLQIAQATDSTSVETDTDMRALFERVLG